MPACRMAAKELSQVAAEDSREAGPMLDGQAGTAGPEGGGCAL